MNDYIVIKICDIKYNLRFNYRCELDLDYKKDSKDLTTYKSKWGLAHLIKNSAET